ncbi:MAG TPA: metallophosphoesterase, partial [Gemmatimonadales bacterium]|nr:metallophosphoesterase [Gemmatimonadales bacterium]
MKLAVFGDLHLSRSSPRYDHAFHVLDVAVKDAIAQGADAFAFLGDIFEGKPHPREYGDFIGLM